MKGKIIVIEGTDCSGKETQAKMLIEKLVADGKNVYAKKLSFPMYDTPTGKIVGGPYLGKDYISESWFPEGCVNVDPKVASLYYAADRKYNYDKKIKYILEQGYNIILDRYVESNMAHQGGKIIDSIKRKEMFDFLEKLEYDFLELPRPDLTVFLYMPYEYSCILKNSRSEKPDGHESSKEHLIHAEKTYLELAKLYNFKKIDCVENNIIKTKEQISEEVYGIIKKIL